MEQKQGLIHLLLALKRGMGAELCAQALTRKAGIQVAARAESTGEALEAVKTTRIDVALIGASLKDGPLSGLRTLQLIHEAHPNIRSVVLLENEEARVITSAFRAGAKGVFSLTDASFKSLCRCVEKVHAGQIWANSSQLNELLAAYSRKAPLQVVSARGERLLTSREGEIVRLVEDGLTNRQISKELGLSEHTVRNNLFRIFDKLGVSTRVELALYTSNHAKAAPAKELMRHKEVASVRPVQKSTAATN
jgi:DNA-binding NarL/FixJ family response regulator